MSSSKYPKSPKGSASTELKSQESVGTHPITTSLSRVHKNVQSSYVSRYLMNDIPRGTTRATLISYLVAPSHWLDTTPSRLARDVSCSITLTDSRLDDELSVAVIEFSKTPEWLHCLNLDPCGFPKRVPLGTLWRGVDPNTTDERGQTPLMRAVMKGGLSLLEAEMMAEFEDTDINIRDSLGRTALHWASVGNHSDMVRLCLSIPECQIGLLDNDGLTAFDLAMSGGGGNEAIPDLFYKSILEIEDTHPQNALLRALTVTSEPDRDKPIFPGVAIFDPIEADNEILVAALINRGVDLTAKNVNGDTALHVAAKMGNRKIVTMLLSAGSKTNATSNGGATPLDYATEMKDKQIMQLLLESDVDLVDEMPQLQEAPDEHFPLPPDTEIDVTAHEQDVRTVLGLDKEKKTDGRVLHQDEDSDSGTGNIDLRAVTNHNDMVRALIQNIESRNESGRTGLLQAALTGDLSTFRVLLELGANTDARDEDQWTSLHLAVRSGHLEIVESLLAKGAEIEAVGSLRYTALLLATENGQTEIVNVLLSAGANITAARDLRTSDDRQWSKISTVYGEQPLHLAAGNGHSEIVKALLARGANTEQIATSKRYTALHQAAVNGHADTVKALLAGGASIESVNSHGETALQLAAGRGQVETVKVLLAAGAQIEARVPGGKTALMLAAGNGHTETVAVLLAAGAKTEAHDWRSQRALMLAAVNGHAETVNSLLVGGAQTDALGPRGRTALMLAAGRGHAETVNALLVGGAQLDMDYNEETALTRAASAGHTEVVRTLLASGARMVANTHSSALEQAANNGHTQTTELLLGSLPKAEWVNVMRDSALDMAVHNSHMETAELLLVNGARRPAARFGHAVLRRLGVNDNAE